MRVIQICSDSSSNEKEWRRKVGECEGVEGDASFCTLKAIAFSDFDLSSGSTTTKIEADFIYVPSNKYLFKEKSPKEIQRHSLSIQMELDIGL